MNHRCRIAGRLLIVLVLAVMLLGALSVSAEDAAYRIPGAMAADPEDSWYLAALEEYDPKLGALYRLFLETVQEDCGTDFALVDGYGRRTVSLDSLPYQYREDDIREYTGSNSWCNILSVAARKEYGCLVDWADLTGIDVQGYCRSLRIDYSFHGYAHQYYIREDREKIIEATEELIAKAGITAENVDTMSEYDKALALHDALMDSVYYLKKDEHQVMYGALVNGYCVCAGYARAYQWLLSQVGIRALYIGGMANGSHAWNMVRLDGVWYESDPTWDDVQYNGLPCRHKYFAISSEEMGRDHCKAYSPLGYPECAVSNVPVDPITHVPLDEKVYTILPAEEEGWSLSYIGSARRGGEICFSILISEDYLPGDDLAVTVSDGELEELSPFRYVVTGFTSDIQVTVTGLARKPSLTENGAAISVTGDICVDGYVWLDSSALPADAGTLTWTWVVDNMPQVYYEAVGELAIPREWTGDKPYTLMISQAMFGHDLILRVKAENYADVLESKPVKIGKCPTEIAGLPECFETKLGGYFSFSGICLKAAAGTRSAVRDSLRRMTVKDSGGSVCFSWSSDDPASTSPLWTPEETGSYTLHVEFGETEMYFGAQGDVPVYVFPADLSVWAGGARFVFSCTVQGIEVSVNRHNPYVDPKYYCAAFYGEDGRLLGCCCMDSNTFSAFTVPGALSAVRAQIFLLDNDFLPVGAAVPLEL